MDARALFATARVARLATAGPGGRPHLVPVCFALDGDTLYTAVDHKPKRTTQLARLPHIAARPEVCLLADRYDDDWSQLWWARADGRAHVVDSGDEHARAVSLLVSRYPQYAAHPPTGPAIVVSVARWTAWHA